MKIYIYSLIAILVFSAAVTTQTQPTAKDKPKTELETFQEKYGVVVIKSFSRLGQIKGLNGTFKILVMEFRNPTNNTKVKGLVVEVETSEKYSNSARSFIEYDEIDSLIKGIGYISKIDKSVTRLNSFEARYKTKGEFEITVFNDAEDKLNAVLSVGSYSQKSVYINLEILATVISELEKAKSVLDGINTLSR